MGITAVRRMQRPDRQAKNTSRHRWSLNGSLRMVRQHLVSWTLPVTLSRDTWGHSAARIYPTGQVPPILGGTAQSLLSGTQEEWSPAQNDFGTWKVLLFLGRPFTQVSLFLPLSTTWEFHQRPQSFMPPDTLTIHKMTVLLIPLRDGIMNFPPN